METLLTILGIYSLSIIVGYLTMRLYTYLNSTPEPPVRNTGDEYIKRLFREGSKVEFTPFPPTPPKRPKKIKIFYLVIHNSSNRVVRIYEKQSKAMKYTEKKMQNNHNVIFRIESFKIK